MGSSKQTSTSSTQPSNPNVTKTVNQLLGGVQDAYSAGPKVFDQSLYTGQGANTQAGLAGLLSASQNPNYFGAANDYAGGLIGSGGLTAGQQGDTATVGNLGSQYQQFANNAGNPSLTESTLMDVAQGKYLDNTDPNYQAMIDRVANQTAADINASIGASGRYGSDVHTAALSDQIGALRTNAAVQNRQNELARQQQALGAIEGTRQAGANNQLSGLAGALGAAGQGFNMGQQGVANAMGASASLPGLWQAMQMPAQTQLAVGAAQDADAQAQRQGEYDLFSRQANADTDLLAKLSGILAGNAQATGTTTTSTTPTTPWWQTALGGAIGLAGLF